MFSNQISNTKNTQVGNLLQITRTILNLENEGEVKKEKRELSGGEIEKIEGS
jgi:hypothetical protein